MPDNLYASLGVPRSASQAQIRHAYLELAKRFHPDLHPDDPVAAEKFKEIHRAFEKLYKPWLWRFRRAASTPEAVLQRIASRRRHGAKRARSRQWAEKVGLGLLGLLIVIGLFAAINGTLRATRPPARSATVNTPETPAREDENPWRETELRRQEAVVAKIKRLGGSSDMDEINQLVTRVDFTGSIVVDAGLDDLKGLPYLTWLTLNGTQVTDAGLAYVQALPQLSRLDLCDTKVTDAGLKHLRGLTGLRRLELSGTQVTDAGLDHLKDLSRLQTLLLAHTKIGDAGLEHIKGLRQLQQLGLSHTRVTDAGLDRLKGLTRLKRLELRGDKLTRTSIENLKAALPEVEIDSSPR